MPSRSLAALKLAEKRSYRLLAVSTDRRLRPLSYEDIEPSLHAALASSVSSWEAYVESIVLETIDAIGFGADPQRVALVTVLKIEATSVVEKFNTPNFENSRSLILRFTGFDPFVTMASNKFMMSARQTQTRLNEILKVRHAFSHGFPVPAFVWTTRYGIRNRLTKRAVSDASGLIMDVASSIDKALGNHLRSVFLSPVAWA